MYFDTKPCRVCGADVELRAREPGEVQESGAVAERDPDGTVDERVCTNADCETRRDGTARP